MPQLSPEQQLFFQTHGYLVVEDMLTGDRLAAIQAEARELATTEPQTVTTRVWHERALFRRPAFRDLLNVEPLLDTAEGLLGPDVQLLALDLLMTRPGCGQTGWHRDVAFVCNKTLSINTGIYLQDMTDAVGPLRVVPGSHRREQFPPSEETLPGEIKVAVKAGSAVMFDAGLWHTGSPNASADIRFGLFPYFGRYFVKRMQDHFTQNLPADLLLTTNPLKRQLLGLGLRPGVLSYHGDDESYNRRGERGVDFLE